MRRGRSGVALRTSNRAFQQFQPALVPVFGLVSTRPVEQRPSCLLVGCSKQLAENRDDAALHADTGGRGDGHPARQQPLLKAATADTSTPDAQNLSQNFDKEPNEGHGHPDRQQTRHPLNTQHRTRNTAVEQHPGLDDLKTTILRELCRREVKPTSGGGDVSRRQNRRSRRDRGATTERGFRKPRTFDMRVGSPILAALPPVDFSRLLDEAHRELEKELL